MFGRFLNSFPANSVPRLFRRATRSCGGWSAATTALVLISFVPAAALADTFNVTGTT